MRKGTVALGFPWTACCRKTGLVARGKEALQKWRSIEGVWLAGEAMTVGTPPVAIGEGRFPIVVSVPYSEVGAENLVIF